MEVIRICDICDYDSAEIIEVEENDKNNDAIISEVKKRGYVA